MGFYRHEKVEKTYDKFSENESDILEGTIELAPHASYQRDGMCVIQGVGMFEGMYRFKKVTHTINATGYTVSCDVRMVFDRNGNPVEEGYRPPAPPQKPKEEVKEVQGKQYTVVKGDNLWSIARKHCKSALNWKDIEDANRELLNSRDSRNKKTPGWWIYPGQVITIPAHALK